MNVSLAETKTSKEKMSGCVGGNFLLLITNQSKNMFHKAVRLYLRFDIFIRNTLIHPTWILASESRHEGSNAPSLGSPVVDVGRMRPVGDFPWLGSLL